MYRICVLMCLMLGLVLAVPLWAAATPAPASLLVNGDFSRYDEAANWPADWPRVEGFTAQQEGGQHFLRITANPDKMVLAYRQVEIPSPRPAALEVKVRVRAQGIEVGQQPWFDGRVMLTFKDSDGKDVPPGLPSPSFRGTSDGWVDQSVVVIVPEGARVLAVMPCMFQAKSGHLDVARCEVFPADAPAPKVTIKPATIPSVTLAIAKEDAMPPALRAVGNQLQTDAGQPVWLQGLCVDSLNWCATGERIDKSIPVAIDDWKANVIRLPVLDKYWFGSQPDQTDGGVAYRKIVDAAIESAASRGAYVVLDLHEFHAPMPQHITFWKDAATRYKNHPAVIFELFNEPHDLSWRVWRDGGSIKEKAGGANVAAENAQKADGDTTVGMQAMVDAVRSVGANNLLVVGGLDWSYDLSGILNGYALDDHGGQGGQGGRGIMYSGHIYPWKSDWQGKVLNAAAKYPIFIGEVGCMADWSGFQFIPVSMRTEKLGPGCTWSQDMLGVIQTHKLNWTGFSFHPTCGPNAISDWNYTPTPAWGVFVKDALAGKQFTTQRLR